MTDWLTRWARRRRLERELDDELRFHVEARTRDLVAEGVAPGEASRQALAELGGLAPITELTRDAHGGRWLDDLVADLRYAARSLAHQPGFAITAILTLTLGIGANAAIFSMVDGVLLRRLAVREPGRLVLFTESLRQGTNTSRPPPAGRWDSVLQ